MRTRRSRTARSQQSGFSLMELIIASALGLIVVTSLVSTFVASQRTNELARALSDIQQDGRFAMEILARSAQRAGKYPYTVSIDGSTYSINFDHKIPDGITTLPSSQTLHYDVLPSITSISNLASDGATDSVAFISYFPSEGAKDCSGITRANALIIEQYMISGTTFQCRPYQASVTNHATFSTTVTYSTQSLLDGIVNLQVEYGVDTNGDSSVNRWTTLGGVATFSNVYAARFWVTMQDDVQQLANANRVTNKTFTTTRFFWRR